MIQSQFFNHLLERESSILSCFAKNKIVYPSFCIFGAILKWKIVQHRFLNQILVGISFKKLFSAKFRSKIHSKNFFQPNSSRNFIQKTFCSQIPVGISSKKLFAAKFQLEIHSKNYVQANSNLKFSPKS